MWCDVMCLLWMWCDVLIIVVWCGVVIIPVVWCDVLVMVGIWCDSDSHSSALHCCQARPRCAGAGEASSDSCMRERMYGRSRTRDHHHHHSDLTSLLSDGSSSTASTRERLLQGRWRRTSEDSQSERRNNRYCGSLSPHRDFSDTASTVSTLRNSDPDTSRSFSSTSSLSHWSAGPDPSRRYRPLNISRTRSFQSVQPTSPDRRSFRHEDDFTFEEYKTLSAQDFRKGIRREERLALEAEDDRLSSNLDLDSQDQDLDRGSLRSGRFSPTVTIYYREPSELLDRDIVFRLLSPVCAHLFTILVRPLLRIYSHCGISVCWTPQIKKRLKKKRIIWSNLECFSSLKKLMMNWPA